MTTESRVKSEQFPNGLTVQELKQKIRNWPEYDANGELTEVWMETGRNLSSPVKFVTCLNMRRDPDTDEPLCDILFEVDG